MQICQLPDGRQLEFYITKASTAIEEPEYVLLLHGMTESSVIFADKRSTRFHYICLDRPGYGGSSAPPKHTYTYEAFAQDVVCLLDYLEIPLLKAVIGHSSGGPCALAVAYFLSTRIDQCILLASDVEYSSCQHLKDPLHAPLLNANSQAEDPTEFGFSTERELHELDLTWYRESVKRNAHQNNAGALHDYYCERKPWNIIPLHSKLQSVQVVVGNLDPYITLEHAMWFQQKMHVFEGYGHFDILLCSKAWSRIEQLLLK